MALSPTAEKFILHWGEMGTRWGVNRTVAQIHALLYLSTDALSADEIAEQLSVARSNVSNSIKELQGWGLVKVSRKIGDRRDHFNADDDVWQMFLTIVEQRKRREIDPTVQLLRECAADTSEPELTAKINQMLGFIDMLTGWYEQMRGVSPKTLARLMKLGSGVARFVSSDKSSSVS